jgi:hypothetical protein
VGVTLIALVLIGMSQWTTIKIKGPGGIDIDLTQLRQQIEETARAVDAVADVAGNNTRVSEGNRQQLLSLTEQLGSKQVIAPAAASAARSTLTALPKADTTRLHSTRLNLRKVVPR